MNTTVESAAADGIPPGRVPARTLSNGARIPAVGMGTFGSDKYGADAVAAAVVEAAALGYRHFDCASVYGNEAQIGASLGRIMASGVRRDELWITSKVWNDRHGDGEVVASCKQSLRDLGLDYLDLYLVHWPFPNFHPKGCSGSYHNPGAKPYIHDAYMRVWAQMEELVRQGLVRTIGTSNMTVAKLKLLLRDCAVQPAVNEMELHPHFQQPELYGFLVANNIQPVGFCPVGSPSRPARDRTPEDTCELDDPVIAEIARRVGAHPAEVCLMWALKRGEVVIPFSVKRGQLLGNLRAAVENPLTDEDMRAIAAIDKRCRLIKGQVFLWREGLTWEALWDEDGTISE
jgi:diketogulonate reductase-like aldo/keto reductase